MSPGTSATVGHCLGDPDYRRPKVERRERLDLLGMESVPEDHSTDLITQQLDFRGIGGAPEAFGQVEEFFLSHDLACGSHATIMDAGPLSN